MTFEEFKAIANFREVKICESCKFFHNEFDLNDMELYCEKMDDFADFYEEFKGYAVCDLHEEAEGMENTREH
jgi:hypothetical protein